MTRVNSRRLNLPVLLLVVCYSIAAQADDHRERASIGQSEHFVFYALPGVSAHHFLHQWARRLEFDGKIEPRMLPELGLDPHAGAPMLGQPQRSQWLEVVGYYQSEFTNERLVFSKRNNQLLDQVRDGRGMETAQYDGDMAVLRSAYGIYYQVWWPDHRQLIDEYLSSIQALLVEYEDCMAAGIQRAYGEWMPEDQKMRVDLAYVTNWAGAYTTGDPVVLHIGVSDPQLQGTLGLELMYHESSHSKWVEPAIIKLVDDAFASTGEETPQRLWHTVLFFTAGTVAQQCLAMDGIEHERYAEVVGLASFDGWREAWAALNEHWKPYLLGSKGSAPEAMRATVHALLAQGEP